MDSRFERILNKSKGFRVNFSQKANLDNSEGEEGEYRINKVNGVSKLFIKLNRKWEPITPEGNLQKNGYVKFGNGFQITWGVNSTDNNSEYTVNFSKSFNAMCVGVIVNNQKADAQYPMYAKSFNTKGFTIDRNNSMSGSQTINFIAIGF